MLTKLSRETLADQAARNLIAFIQAHAMKPGSLLPSETQLASDLGVSRPIIREALKSLEGKGIIEVVSGKGSVVKPLDSQLLLLFFQRALQIEQEALIDLLELRKGVEVQSVALAAQRRTPEDIAKLAAVVADMRRNVHSPDAYVALDIEFHQLIAAMTRNMIIYHLVSAIREAINQALHENTLRPQVDEQLERVQAGHEAILACIERGDAGEAERAMAMHFDDAINSLVYQLIAKDTLPNAPPTDVDGRPSALPNSAAAPSI